MLYMKKVRFYKIVSVVLAIFVLLMAVNIYYPVLVGVKGMKKIYLRDFGIEANSEKDAVPAIKAAIRAANEYDGVCEIVFDEGVYNAHLADLSSLEIHVSNTIAEGSNREKGECDSIERNTPFLIDGMSDIIINGSNSLIKCHGKMTEVILRNSENITFKNIRFDYVNPTVTEMTVIAVGNNYLDCKISEEFPYKIVDGKIVWYGENYEFSMGISQLFDANSGFTWRYPSPLEDKNAKFEELSSGLVRLYFNPNSNGQNPYGAKLGFVFQMREPIRDECGVIISDCKYTSFINTTMHFMSGIGFIAQNSDGIYLDRFNVYPSVGRTASCAADFMHFSGCRGKITIKNGFYLGAHDDAINVHGTHLKITDVDYGENKVKLKFMHSQTYGIGGFKVGDEIVAVNPYSLLEVAKTKILSVEELNPYEIALSVESVEGFTPDFVVENISATAEVLIKNNHFERIPTRGILITTRKPVVIEDNVFKNVKGCAVLIADDARSWYESGCVRDVTIRNNTYKAGGNRFVIIAPECGEFSTEAVHSGIKITDNLVELSLMDEVISAKNSKDIVFSDNVIYGPFEKCRITLDKVQNAVVNNNIYNGSVIQ
ncbi:MAG: right-handed parallel beta-helix repeat-containing protein, partial [Clostridia bacterium]|nr:right-handed parallel beta-helix repeat-containing protein [Clostridia bacterium]